VAGVRSRDVGRALITWVLLAGVYAGVIALGGPDTAAPVPWAVDRLRDEIGTLPVQLAGAAATALAFTLLGGTARRVIGEPWSTTATLLVGLSPPALACATRVGADPWAAVLLAGAVALTARCRTDPTRKDAIAAALLLAVLPWFGVWYGVAAVLVLVVLIRWTRRRGRPVVALACAEVLLASGVSLYEVGLPASPPAPAGGGALPLLAVLLDRDAGVLRWAPVLLLALAGAFWLWRSLRDGVSRLVPERADVEAAALLSLVVVVATLACAAFAGLSPLPAMPVAVPLAAWGVRRAPRAAAVLGLLTIAASVWCAAEGDFDRPGLAVFPDVGAGGAWPIGLGAALAVALLTLAIVEWRSREAMLNAAATGR
jgi:hypothetical protein